MISEAKQVIPGGVQHNLAFNYPFPIVMTKAKGNRLYDIDGNEYEDHYKFENNGTVLRNYGYKSFVDA